MTECAPPRPPQWHGRMEGGLLYTDAYVLRLSCQLRGVSSLEDSRIPASLPTACACAVVVPVLWFCVARSGLLILLSPSHSLTSLLAGHCKRNTQALRGASTPCTVSELVDVAFTNANEAGAVRLPLAASQRRRTPLALICCSFPLLTPSVEHSLTTPASRCLFSRPISGQ